MYWLFLLVLSLGHSLCMHPLSSYCRAVWGVHGWDTWTPALPAAHPGRLPGNPNQWSITCQSQWWMPPSLTLTVLGPAACITSVSLTRACLFSSSSNREQCCPVSWWGYARGEAQDRKVLLPFQSCSCSPASLTLPPSYLILDRKGLGKAGHAGHPSRHKALQLILQC